MTNSLIKDIKIFIISDEIPDSHPEFKGVKWICDRMKNEFSIYFYENMAEAEDADIIWYFASWNSRYVPKGFNATEWRIFLKTKYVITTFHHIDEDKLKTNEHSNIFNFTTQYANLYHSICDSATKTLKTLNHGIKIAQIPLWENENLFYRIKKHKLREKFGFSKDAFLIGSFQKDSEGKKYWRCPECFECNRDENTNVKCGYCNKEAPRWSNSPNKLDKFEFYPKLSKGPDLFVKIVSDMKKKNKNVEVVLTGLRRDYVQTNLDRNGVKHHFFGMTGYKELKEIWNCLDLYLVSARFEGGPRGIFEAGLTKTPIISTDVGVAKQLLASESIFDKNDWKSYEKAKPNVEEAYKRVSKLSINNYLDTFFEKMTEDYRSSGSIASVQKNRNVGAKERNFNIQEGGNINILIRCNKDTTATLDKKPITLHKGTNIILYNNKGSYDLQFTSKKEIDEIKVSKMGEGRIDNKKFNILLCADKDYFVGTFACLNSVITNCGRDVPKIHFNFFIPLEDSKELDTTMKKFLELKKVNIEYTVVMLNINILSKEIMESKCYKGGNHLLNLGNFARLLVGDIFSCKKIIYLDSDSVVQSNIYQKLKRFKLKQPMYALKMNKPNLTLPVKGLLNKSDKWKKLIGKDIDIERAAYMGAPFIADCSQWVQVFDNINKIIYEHNRTDNGLYKLFTMSLQNIVFYDKIDDISSALKCLPDCGSLRKNWDDALLSTQDVLDWSGNLKPWFNNGLHKKYWDKYDILKLSKNFGDAVNSKATVEQFKTVSDAPAPVSVFVPAPAPVSVFVPAPVSVFVPTPAPAPVLVSASKILKKKPINTNMSIPTYNEEDIINADVPSVSNNNSAGYNGDKRNLVVCTTAINRPDLHNANIKEWAEFINTMRKDFNILWVLNVDEVELLDFTYEQTVLNFRNLIPSNIELIVLKKKEPGFLSTCQRVVAKVKATVKSRKYADKNTYVFWLEDDWKLNKVCTSNVDLVALANILTDNSYMNFAFIRRNYFWALAPSMMKYNYFKAMHYTCWTEAALNKIKGDPEHILGKFFIKKITKNHEDLKTINIVNNQWKKIGQNYLNSDFFQKENRRVLIYDTNYQPKFRFGNNIQWNTVQRFIGGDYAFIRITPGW